MLKDSYQRVHDYLRISLTDRCNLRCFYCMPEEHYDFASWAHLMQASEIEQIARVFVNLGVTKIRLTGGEPLVRKDFGEILEGLSPLPTKLTLTTNAILLHHHLDALERAGVESLNISLDTLSPERFKQLTRRDQFERTWENIQEALGRGMQVKINVVVMKSVNEEELLDFVEWTKRQPIEVRFIEFMPFEGNRWTGNQVLTKAEILKRIGSAYQLERILGSPQDTSEKFYIPGHRGSIATISTMSAPFCSGCNRMRLTADGKMKNCLFSIGEMDLLAALRRGEPIEPLIRQHLFIKAERLGGQLDPDFESLNGAELVNRSMIKIGG